MRHARRTVFLALALACSSEATAVAGPDAVNGEWVYVRATNEPPGFFLDLMLTTSGQNVSGTGTWNGEALLGGTASATGSASGAHVVIDVTLIQNATGKELGRSQEHFDMTFTSRDDLEGTKIVNGVTSAVHLTRSNL